MTPGSSRSGLPQAVPGVVGAELVPLLLASRRQLDYQLNTDGPEVLLNLNRPADTEQESRPVNQTLEYFLGESAAPPRGLAAADDPAVDPHEGPGRGAAPGAGRRPDRRPRIFGVSLPALRPLPDAAARRDDAVHAPDAGGQVAGAGQHGLLHRHGVHRQPRHPTPAGPSQEQVKQDRELKRRDVR